MTDSTNIAGARPAYDFEPIRTRGAARRTARAGGNVDLRIAKAHVLSMLAHPSPGLAPLRRASEDRFPDTGRTMWWLVAVAVYVSGGVLSYALCRAARLGDDIGERLRERREADPSHDDGEVDR